ncbi:MAG: N-acetylglucosamine-6-phosphate deacetylase [Firmicutes bacterium]|nr:N-acetylglucosamine-6-phosphate deacetylase [Bacillota bacterium]
MRTLIQNGPVITPNGIVPMGGILVENGTIVEILDRPVLNLPVDITVIDAAGRTISPGFVDIHVHGGGGCEVMGATPAEINQICRAHSRYGTTSILPTTLAAPLNDICTAIDNIRTAQGRGASAEIMGVHLEGPYFAQSQRGAQAAEYIIYPTEANMSLLLDRWAGGVRMMGAAPEIPGGMELGRELVKRGIVASVAHSDATFEDVEMAIENGYTDVTHIYSGCSNVHRVNAYRVAGVVEAGLYFDGLTTQVIADGKHLPPSLLRLIYKCKGADKIALITDGLGPSATDIPEGTVYTQGNGVEIILDDGVMKLMDKQAFAGSCATMQRLVRNMVELAGVPLYDAVKMAAETPAKVIGAGNKGRLAPGCDADVILFDSEINVSMVMVRGVVVN